MVIGFTNAAIPEIKGNCKLPVNKFSTFMEWPSMQGHFISCLYELSSVPPRLCPHTAAQTWLCPDTLVPQHELWPDTIMYLDNNNIIMSTILWVNLIGENTSMLKCCWRSEVNLFYCSAITSSIPTGIFRNFITACQGTKYVSGHRFQCTTG